jgi:hypothetical protein
MGTTRQAEVSTQGRSATNGHPLAAGRCLNLLGYTHFFEIFLFKIKEFLEVGEMRQGSWENGCTTSPFFEACPYTWKC